MRSPIGLIRLAERYGRYLTERAADPYLAWRRLGRIIRALPPEQAYDLTCHFIRTLPRSCLPSFGGGTLAHLIDHHGEALIDWIEREARRDVHFRAALSGAWVAGEDVHPTILIRLRVATRARIHIVRRPHRDAAYTAMFERWITERPQRRIRHRKHPVHMQSFVDKRDREAKSHSKESVAPPRAMADVHKGVVYDMKVQLSLWFSLFPLKLRYGLARRWPRLGYIAKGAVMVWYLWFLTTIAAPLLLPVLVAALWIMSASPLTDLIVVALAIVLATVGASVASLVTGIVAERRRQIPNLLTPVGVMTLVPYVALLGLIARSEHGVVVALAVVAVLVARPFVQRFFEDRAALRHV